MKNKILYGDHFVVVMVFVIVTMAFVVVGDSCVMGKQDVMRAVLSPSARMHRKLAQWIYFSINI